MPRAAGDTADDNGRGWFVGRRAAVGRLDRDASESAALYARSTSVGKKGTERNGNASWEAARRLERHNEGLPAGLVLRVPQFIYQNVTPSSVLARRQDGPPQSLLVPVLLEIPRHLDQPWEWR
ncbi:hypothetical protein ACCO45_011072 [Purpureocillium lilacinum]|uniref:Uncharacterized protein n=1 Tax=Purpureocillium lilacinum TaxID=33203 RepID=A0ACC4DI27_PURLI